MGHAAMVICIPMVFFALSHPNLYDADSTPRLVLMNGFCMIDLGGYVFIGVQSRADRYAVLPLPPVSGPMGHAAGVICIPMVFFALSHPTILGMVYWVTWLIRYLTI